MKPLSLICAMIVLVLNFVPCADAQETADQYTTFSYQQSATDHTHPLGDQCSPFCHCSCCAASSIAPLHLLITLPLQNYSTTAIPYFTKRYVSISLPIWQPPQWS